MRNISLTSLPLVSGTQVITNRYARKLRQAKTMKMIHLPFSSSIAFKKTEFRTKLAAHPIMEVKVVRVAMRYLGIMSVYIDHEIG